MSFFSRFLSIFNMSNAFFLSKSVCTGKPYCASTLITRLTVFEFHQLCRDTAGSYHANGYGLSVRQRIHILNSMAQCMTKVQQAAFACLKLILFYDGRFDHGIAADQLTQGRFIISGNTSVCWLLSSLNRAHL